ncbi:MAG: signal transduction histidine kinase [Polaribacter sp.]
METGKVMNENSMNNNINENSITPHQTVVPLTSKKTPMSENYFPWLSISYSLFCIYILGSQLELNLPFSANIQTFVHHPNHIKGLLICLILVVTLELIIFKRVQLKNQSIVESFQQQVSESWKQKNKQQLRANTYSDHTSKLKSFISDKLIEYMDFDEKFIHFKGIASEVRHNGVISYDKINTALNRAIEQQHFLAIYEQDNEQSGIDINTQTENSLYDYQSAKDAITYLWDLLDLSTAENMSLYIGKKLIDYEESYFQTQLNFNQHTDTSLTIGYHPTFFPLQSLLMSLQLFTESEQVRHLLINGKINSLLFSEHFNFKNEHFFIDSHATKEILGNPNHIVLLLENLIKNAQFFSNKTRYKQKSDRIIINIKTSLESQDESNQTDKYVYFSIYNRGINIAGEDLEQIFKLGYTTRRKKNEHGQGLGLYFVKEIVNGYQGTINAINILSEESNYKLILGLSSGDSFDYYIQNKKLNERMSSCFVEANILECDIVENDILKTEGVQYKNELKIEHDIPVKSIQIMNMKTKHIFSIDGITRDNKKSLSWVDNTSQFPEWEISLSPFKKIQIFTFKALDITGVKFEVNIPSVIE